MQSANSARRVSGSQRSVNWHGRCEYQAPEAFWNEATKMPELNCILSPGIWELLLAHSQKTRQPVPHIVDKALADYFAVAHHTLYQVSSATALVEVVYQGAVRVGTLPRTRQFRARGV